MKIYTSNDKIDEFVIHLTVQEMKNFIKGLMADRTMKNSPWSIGTVNQMEQAIRDNTEYRLKRWE